MSGVHEVRCCVCGDAGVGKTTLLHRYTRSEFKATIEPTIGAAYQCRVLGERCKLHLWDTAGQERFAALCPMYLRQADIVLVALEAGRLGGADAEGGAAERWLRMCRMASHSAILVLVATKADLVPVAELYRARARLAELASRLGVRHHHLVSSKNSEGCAALFDEVDTIALDIAPSRPPCGLRLPVDEEVRHSGCCY